MMEILEPQCGDRFVGRWEKIKELKAKIMDNRIVVVRGDRGIGKTNLMWVMHKTLEREGKDCHFIRGNFHEKIGEIFKLPWFKRITSFSLPIGGFGWIQEKSLSQLLKESEEKIIFVENAQVLDKEALERIFDAVSLNNKLKFILEVPTPHVRDFKLKAGSYSVLNVEELPNKDTVKLVKNAYYNFSNDVVEKIATKSKGYPYVARVLVYICVDKKSKERMHKFLDTLKDDEMQRLDQIHKEVLETLREDTQDIIEKLSIAPQILTYKLIEAFCGEEIDIRDIVERGILKNEKKFYWIYHPLFRDYLRKTPRTMEKKKEIYCKAIDKIKRDFDSIYMLFEVLNEPHIFNELIEILEDCNSIYYVGTQCYIWGYFDQAILSWSRILKIVKESNNKEWESIATGSIGCVYKTRGNLDRALEYFEQALKLGEEIGHKKMIANAYQNMGNVYQIRGDLDGALEYYGKALKLNEEMGHKEGVADTYVNMGNVYGIRYGLDKALEYFEKAIELYKGMGRKEGMADVYINMGNVYQIRGNFDKALKYYGGALRLDGEMGNKQGIAADYGNMGIIYGIKGEIDKAFEYFGKSLKLNEELGRKEGIAKQLGNMGIVYEIKDEIDKALEYHGKALKLHEELGSKEGMAADYGNMSNVYTIRGEIDKALEYYGKALLIFRDMGSRIQEATTLIKIGDVFIKKGDKERAIDCYLQAQELAIESPLLFEDINKKVNELLGIKKEYFLRT